MDAIGSESSGGSREPASGFRRAYLRGPEAEAYRDKFDAGPLRRIADHRERALVSRLLERVAPASGRGLLLDVPCGAGRFLGVAAARRWRVVTGDSSTAMLHLCGAVGSGVDGWVGNAALSAFALPFRDRQFDAVLCIRFLHHFATTEERVAVLRALGRVARGAVVVSFFSSRSLQSLRREIRRRWRGRSSRRYSLSPRAFRREAERAGFRVERILSSFPGGSEWSVALLRRGRAD